MKKYIILILALILLLGLGAMSVNAKAIKEPLFFRTSQTGFTDVEAGWVIVNKNAAGEISVEVSLKKVEEIDTPFCVNIKYEGYEYVDVDGEFMTNGVGNGNCHCTIDSDEHTWVQVYVTLKGTGNPDGYMTAEISIVD